MPGCFLAPSNFNKSTSLLWPFVTRLSWALWSTKKTCMLSTDLLPPWFVPLSLSLAVCVLFFPVVCLFVWCCWGGFPDV
jgi:hypothetical protein